MLASLDWQRNRRGMFQVFVSDEDGGHLPFDGLLQADTFRRRLRLHKELAL
jgi:hypothetical protein